MKLDNFKEIKGNGDRLKIEADWADKMRRPARVKVHLHKAPDARDLPSNTLIDDDRKEATDALFAIADIAYSLGWRPAGLPGAVAHFIQNYKIPRVE